MYSLLMFEMLQNMKLEDNNTGHRSLTLVKNGNGGNKMQLGKISLFCR